MNKLIHTSRTRLKFILISTVFLYCCNVSFAANLDSQTLRYSVDHGKVHAGELEIIIENNSDQIKTTVISHLSAIAKLFLSGLTTQSWFRAEPGGAILERGHSLKQNTENVQAQFHVDYENNLLKLEPGDTSEIQPNEIFDSTSFPVALITSDVSSIDGKIIREVNSRKARQYQYRAPQQESIELNGQKYETWKVTRTKVGDSNRSVTLWLDKNNQNIPVKIVSTKKKKDTVMTLVN